MQTNNVVLHRTKLIKILSEIYGDPRLAKALGFKGGTAAYFCYELPRNSVDLDFNLLNPKEGEYVLAKIKQILQKYGEVVDATIKHFSVFFLLKYAIGSWKIKIEISRRPTNARYVLMSVMGVGVQVMVKEDMVACKLAALLTRKSMVMRDLFDTWFFLKNEWMINEEVFTNQTGWSLKEGLEGAIRMVESVQKKDILQGVAELLSSSQRVWVKNKLKEELLFLLRLQLELAKKI